MIERFYLKIKITYTCTKSIQPDPVLFCEDLLKVVSVTQKHLKLTKMTFPLRPAKCRVRDEVPLPTSV
jgi:hypothetical protein